MAKKRTAQPHSTEAQKLLDAKLLAYCAVASGALLAAPPAKRLRLFTAE